MYELKNLSFNNRWSCEWAELAHLLIKKKKKKFSYLFGLDKYHMLNSRNLESYNVN